MNLNFPPIVVQEFFIDTDTTYGGAGHRLTDHSAWAAVHNLAPFPSQGWLRDLDWSFGGAGTQPARPYNFDLQDLGNEGELLSMMAWLGDMNAHPPGSAGSITGNVTETAFKHMKIFIGKVNFNTVGGISTAPEDSLDYPDPYHGPQPTDLFYESDTLYPGFSESVDVASFVAGTRTPFFQENFSTPIPYVRGSEAHNQGELGMGIVWKYNHENIGGPTGPGRSVIRIRITARRFR
jgi:hypothetical protein